MKAATKELIDNYVANGIYPGNFLKAVLSNDLKGAFAYADDENRADLHEIVRYVYNNTPSVCQGTPDKFAAWINGVSNHRRLRVNK